ncbi:MAG: hypothetical protein NT170_00515 [Candidatus Moranbacteria bacterium]|nr:hypothetical protein [Candidatus Moranbacteria bacterium]
MELSQAQKLIIEGIIFILFSVATFIFINRERERAKKLPTTDETALTESEYKCFFVLSAILLAIGIITCLKQIV